MFINANMAGTVKHKMNIVEMTVKSKKVVSFLLLYMLE